MTAPTYSIVPTTPSDEVIDRCWEKSNHGTRREDLTNFWSAVIADAPPSDMVAISREDAKTIISTIGELSVRTGMPAIYEMLLARLTAAMEQSQ